MADGAYRWQGNAPAPDAARVAEIDAAWDETKADAFAEPARAAAVERIERALAVARTSDLTEAAAQLTHARSVLDGLDPEALEPRRGLAGLFDGRGGRLKRFRDLWRRSAAGLSATAKLIQRAADIEREWLDGVGTLGLTAGASAPESLVREVIDRLGEWREVEEHTLTSAEERMIFKLPRELVD